MQANIVKNMGDMSDATGVMALIPQNVRDAMSPMAANLAGAVNKSLD